MRMRDLLWWGDSKNTSESQATVSGQDIALRELLENFDLVEVVPNDGDPFLVVADRAPVKSLGESLHTPDGPVYTPRPIVTRQPDGSLIKFAEPTPAELLREIGTSSPSPFTSSFRTEYNQELVGLRGLQKFDQMRRSDGTVAGTLRLVKTPVLAGRWHIQPAGKTDRDKEVARFVWKCLTEFQSISWTQVLTESLLMAEFGYYMFEKVFEPRQIGRKKRIVWKKLAPRHPMDVRRWVLDANGGPKGVIMYGDADMGDLYGSAPTVNGQSVTTDRTAQLWRDALEMTDSDIWIPIEKLLVFTNGREAGNIEGISVLRPAYKHWYYKEQLYKIDAIQKERHGIGVPVIKLPPGFTAEDKKAANELGRNLRTNERAHVVLPPNWELMFAKLEGQPVDALKSVEHHDNRIRENVLGGFNNPTQNTKEEDQTMFLKASRYVADIVCETFNAYAIPELVKFNYPSTVEPPKLRVRRIGEVEEQRTLSFAVRNMVGAKVIQPDEQLEEYMRDQLDLPEADLETRRDIDGTRKQDGPDNVGMPRQRPTPPVGTPSGNAGQDRSGGK